MNIKLTLPIAAVLAIASLVAGGGVPAARRATVWHPGC